jgi:hypothetical protein
MKIITSQRYEVYFAKYEELGSKDEVVCKIDEYTD